MARRFATRIGAIRTNRFGRADSQKNPYFITSERFTRIASNLRFAIFGPDPLQKCVRDFCCINFGGFCRGFSWRIFLGTFSLKNEEKKSGEKNPQKNPVAQKQKIRGKSVLPKTDPKNFQCPETRFAKGGSVRLTWSDSRELGHLRKGRLMGGGVGWGAS